MKKVVYNACYGGFGLSQDAMLLLALMGFPLEKTPLEKFGFKLSDFTLEGPNGFLAHPHYDVLYKDGHVYSHGLNGNDKTAMSLRSHPVLVKVVEFLGSKASGSCAKLLIDEISDDDVYRIEEYDGFESVTCVDQYVGGFLYEEPPLPAEMQLTENKLMLEKATD